MVAGPIDFGETYSYRHTVYDVNDNPANAGTATATITLPDGTVKTSGIDFTITNSGTGLYDLDWTTTVPGRHLLKGSATGGILSSQVEIFEDPFYVESVGPALVALDEAREHLQLVDTEEDETLRGFINTASDLAERYTGKTWRRTAVTAELHDGGTDVITLRRQPVLSITSVTESGSAVPSSGYVLDSLGGWLYRGSSLYATAWRTGRQTVSVTYVAGPSDGLIPPSVRQGVLECVRHLWESRRGATGLPATGAATEWSPGLAFSLPRRVAELWDLNRLDGVA